MAYDTTDLVTVAQLKKNAQKTIALAASLEEKINNRIAGVHTYGGTKTFAQLTNALLDKAHAGYIYNISDDFTTTSDFVEGAGKKCTAGTNVGVAEVSAAVYTETSDDTVNAEKTYYESRNGGYSLPRQQSTSSMFRPAISPTCRPSRSPQQPVTLLDLTPTVK